MYYANDKIEEWSRYIYPDGYDYKYGKIIREVKDKEDEDICLTPLVLCGKSEEQEDGSRYFSIRYEVDRKQKEFMIKQEDIQNNKRLASLLGSHCINAPDTTLIKKTQSYLAQCIYKYENNLKTVPITVQNGWNEDCSVFALGKWGITADGINPIMTLVDTEQHYKYFNRVGTLKKWVAVVKPIMEYDLSRFLFYDAMTAPLKKPLKIESHTQIHHGDTGRAKSAQENVNSSTFGDPKNMEFIAGSSKVGIMAHVAGMCDIPVDIEEATGKTAKGIIAEAVYDIANGKEKGRGQTDGKLRNDIRTFRTTVHVTCENPIREDLNDAGASYRTGQIGDLLPEGLGEMVNAVKRGVQDNYGFYFPIYIKHIIQNKDGLEELYNEALLKIDTSSELSKESKGIAERSKYIYAGVLVAGWLCEEVFEEIGLPIKTKEEVEDIVNHYFEECIIGDPVEADYVRALRLINDWIITDYRCFERRGSDRVDY
ncbi:MAG TPA: DUF927 domain-containing protein, partial [Clostridia bacterium]|nr:DUF927 domain-containing protein [Clostridia bacterium]